MNTVFVGIDLGKAGAVHLLEDCNNRTHVMILNKEGELDIKAMHRLLYGMDDMHKIHVVFEALTPLHLSSKKSNWSLAHQFGAIEALCVALSIPYTKVAPKVWQAEMLSDIAPLRKKDGTIDTKARALLKVKQLFPDLQLTDPNKPKSKVPHDGIVDAILLAEYGRRKIK